MVNICVIRHEPLKFNFVMLQYHIVDAFICFLEFVLFEFRELNGTFVKIVFAAIVTNMPAVKQVIVCDFNGSFR